MTASGSGDYPNCGVLTPEGLSDGGRTNKGKWQECSSNGKYEFHMSSSGLAFDGSYTRGESDTCLPALRLGRRVHLGRLQGEHDPAPAQPRACGASVVNAFAAAKTCDLGKLPFGSEWSVPAPKAGSTVDISPEPMRPTAHELLAALRELIAEEEEYEIALTLAVNNALKSGGDEVGGQALSGCLLLGDIAVPDTKYIGYETEQRLALVRACVRLITRGEERANARAAAGDCKTVFVPAFSKGRKVTKRMRRRAVAAAKEQLAASCNQRRVGRLSFSIRARGKRATLPEVIGGRRLRVKVARRVPEGAPEQRFGVRWRQRQR